MIICCVDTVPKTSCNKSLESSAVSVSDLIEAQERPTTYSLNNSQLRNLQELDSSPVLFPLVHRARSWSNSHHHEETTDHRQGLEEVKFQEVCKCTIELKQIAQEMLSFDTCLSKVY